MSRSRSMICFFARHQWVANGLCSRCGSRCMHSVQVWEPSTRNMHCLDCRALAPYPVYPDGTAKPARRTLVEWTQERLQRIFGWDAGPYS